MLGELLAVASEVVLTRVPMARSADPRRMAEFVEKQVPLKIIENPAEALRFLVERVSPDDVVLVAGSLYLLGEVRPHVARMAPGEGKEDPFGDARV